jgi:hypothetical protein
VPETPSAAGVERRVSCAADIHVTVVELLLFAPSSIRTASVTTLAARKAAGDVGVHNTSLKSACCNSKHAETFTFDGSFLSTWDSAIVLKRLSTRNSNLGGQYPEYKRLSQLNPRGGQATMGGLPKGRPGLPARQTGEIDDRQHHRQRAALRVAVSPLRVTCVTRDK